jgi:hypothetical protein
MKVDPFGLQAAPAPPIVVPPVAVPTDPIGGGGLTPSGNQPLFPTFRFPKSFPDWMKSAQQCQEEKEEEDRCSKRKNYCIVFCQYELDMPGRTDNTGPYRACIRRCMNDAGCDY